MYIIYFSERIVHVNLSELVIISHIYVKFNNVDKVISPENIYISNILNAQSTGLHVLIIDNKVLNCFIYPFIYA